MFSKFNFYPEEIILYMSSHKDYTILM